MAVPPNDTVVAVLKNCSVLNKEALPISKDFISNIKDWNDAEAVMLWVCLAVTLLTFGVCVEGIVYLSRNIMSWSMRVQSCWQVAIYGLLSVGSLLAMMMPRSANDIDNVLSLLFALCQYELLNLFLDGYLAGDVQIVKLYGDSQVIDSSQLQQCTKCCKCLPKFGVSRTSLQRIRIIVFQSTLFHALGLIITIVLYDDSKLAVFENRSSITASPILTVVLALSKILAVYGLSAASQVFPKDLQKKYKIRQKYGLLGFIIVFTQLQSFIIQILLTVGAIKCNPLLGLSGAGRASYVHHTCLIFEVLLLCLVARCAVWKFLVPELDHMDDLDKMEVVEVKNEDDEKTEEDHTPNEKNV